MANIIETRGLLKRYGDVTAVNDITLDIEEGSFFGVIGPNGAGKTTLLEIIEGIREPDAGTAKVLGLDTWPRNRQLLPQIGVQFQSSAFFERLSVTEQLTIFADLYGTPHRRVAEMLELVGLTDKADTRTEDLSGGQARRLSIACALVHDPQVVFLDEPTTGLDPQSRRNLWDLLSKINDDGRTVVLTTHYRDEAERLCDTIAVIDRGSVLANDSPSSLIAALDAPYRIHIERDAIEPGTVASMDGVESTAIDDDTLIITTKDPAPVLTALAGLDALAGLRIRGATLEDVFLTLTGREYRP